MAVGHRQRHAVGDGQVHRVVDRRRREGHEDLEGAGLALDGFLLRIGDRGERLGEKGVAGPHGDEVQPHLRRVADASRSQSSSPEGQVQEKGSSHV